MTRVFRLQFSTFSMAAIWLVTIAIFLRVFSTWWAPEALFRTPRGESDVVWVSVNVSDSPFQGDAHLIAARGGPTLLIDGGQFSKGKELLLPFLNRVGIKKIDTAFITHNHSDHYGGIIELLEAGFPILELYWDEPRRETCELEGPGICEWVHIEQLKRLLKQNRVVWRSTKEFENIKIGKFGNLEKVVSFTEETCPVSRCSVNDLSIVSKLTIGDQSVLFAGDVDEKVGEWLVENLSEKLRSDFLKVPHHGTDSLPSLKFFERVNPIVTVVSAFYSLWCQERSDKTRNWIENKNVRVLVSGSHGHIYSHFFSRGGSWVRMQFQATWPVTCDASKLNMALTYDWLATRRVCHSCAYKSN